jgi:cGMP-dependent 3',5'-cyclic phosphodiesterase
MAARRPTDFLPDMDKFSCIPRNIPDEDTIPAVVSMMDDLHFIEKFNIKPETLDSFLLKVKKGYLQDVPYHNWSHAFSVAHFCYVLLKNTQWNNYFGDFEALGLFLTCLCHDIGHNGVNSYSSAPESLPTDGSECSQLEKHHFEKTMAILNSDDSNIFENFTTGDRQKMTDLIHELILATDLAAHGAVEDKLEKIAATKDGFKTESRMFLRLMMTACDLSDDTKIFRSVQTVTPTIFAEFFQQGDTERKTGRQPQIHMDKERAIIPELEIEFIGKVVLPVYRILACEMPETVEVAQVVEQNRNYWSVVNRELTDRGLPRNMTMFQQLPAILDTIGQLPLPVIGTA